jgi:hypothetical protein
MLFVEGTEGSSSVAVLATNASVVSQHGFSGSATPDFSVFWNAPWNWGFAEAFSSDGALVAGAAVDLTTYDGRVAVYPVGGSVASFEKIFTGTSAGIASLGDGSHLHLLEVAGGEVIDLATGQSLGYTSYGTGGYHDSSPDGSVVAAPGFDLRLYKKSGSVLEQQWTYAFPGSTFVGRAAVSQDGSHVLAAAFDYSTYNKILVAYFSVSSGTPLWSVTLEGNATGYQMVPTALELSDDGSRGLLGHWGDGTDTPELLVYDLSDGSTLASFDLAESVFGADLSGDGTRWVAGTKSVHANVMGAGGYTYAGTVAAAAPHPCASLAPGSNSAIPAIFLGLLALPLLRRRSV